MAGRRKKRLLSSLVPLLRGMRGKPVIVELKNDTIIEGLVIQVDNCMKCVGIMYELDYVFLWFYFASACCVRSVEMERVIARRHQNV